MLSTRLWNYDTSLALILISILQLFTGCLAVSSCPQHLVGRRRSYTAVFKDTCYLFVNNERYWKTAKADCLRLGGDMLSVKDQETMDFIHEKLSSKELSWDREGVWLGARYISGRWRWTDGTIMEYTNWAPDEPSKYIGLYSPCLQVRAEDDWKWHNRPCGALAFHYNYVCQFPTAITTTTTPTTTTTSTTTPTTTTTTTTTTMIINGSGIASTTMSKYEMVLRESKDLKSDLYSQLGKNVYQLLVEEGVSHPSITHLLKAAMATKKTETDDSEEGTSTVEKGRVSSSATSHVEDNGNKTILIIVLSLTAGFLIIILVTFLIIRRHYRRMRQKNEERTIHYHNGPSGNGAAIRREPEDQPPLVPTSRPPPLNDVYLTPTEVTETYSQVNHTRGVTQTTLVQNSSMPAQEELFVSSNATNGQIGAYGSSDTDFDMNLPLIPASLSGAASEPSTRNAPTESCACHGTLAQSQSDYVDMRSMSSLQSTGKVQPDEDKHTYCNTHPQVREPIANENLYETLP